MTERAKFEANEQRDLLLDLYHICHVCGEKPSTQLAHRIPQTEIFIKKYGAKVIHHPKNLVCVCGLDCNSKVNIQNNPIERIALVKEIREELGNDV